MTARPIVTTGWRLLRASHLEPVLAVTALTALLAIDAGHSAGTALLVTSAVFCGQLSIGWSNDLVDVHRDRMVQRVDKPLAVGTLSERLVRVATGVALVLCVVLSLLCGLASGLTHLLLGVGSGWSYNLGLKRTRWSWLPYAVAFGSLPAVVWLALRPPELPPAWMPAAGALIGIGAHLVNALPDLDDDAASGVRGLPHALGPRNARLVAIVVLLAASALAFAGPGGRAPAWAWLGLVAVLVLAVVGLRAAGRLAFHAAVAIAVVDVVLLTFR